MAKDISPEENREIAEWTRKKQWLLNKPVLTAAFSLFRAQTACEFPALLAEMFAACLASEEAKEALSAEAEEMRAAAREANRARKDAGAAAVAQRVLGRPGAPPAGDEAARLTEAIQVATRAIPCRKPSIIVPSINLTTTSRANHCDGITKTRT